jgi:septum formation protein
MTGLVLASKSRARAALLTQAGIVFDMQAADIDERGLEADWIAAGHGPAEVARRLAEAKAGAVSAAFPGCVVIGADQTLALGDRRLAKAAGRAEAREHLMSLRGRIHHLHSGVALVRDGTVLFATVASAAMSVRAFSPAFLDDYLDAVGDGILSSVGCYEFEGRGIQLFDRIDGDYFTILGLPLLPLLGALRQQGLVPS